MTESQSQSHKHILKKENYHVVTVANGIEAVEKLETSVLLADDIMPDKMILCQLMLLSQGVNIIGLDMQNNIEVDKTEQKYCKIKENKTSKYHYAKIRKSVEKIKKWNT